jgi:hypothetical protein
MFDLFGQLCIIKLILLTVYYHPHLFLEGKKMKKLLILVTVILFVAAGLATAQQKKIYNDGEIDYVPISAKFVLDAEDSGSTISQVQYSIDGGKIKVYREPITFSAEGRHVIAYRAIDKTGNISKETFYSCIVDDTPPKILVSAVGPAYVLKDKAYLTSNTAIVLAGEDNLSGTSAIYVSVDDSPFRRYTGSATIQGEGLHTGKAYAVDNVGNRTKTFLVQGVVDNTPPQVEITTKGDMVDLQGSIFVSTDTSFSLRAWDNVSGVKEILFSVNGSPFMAYVEPVKAQVPGSYTVRAKAIDNLGNESRIESISFTVDAETPDASLTPVLE